MDEKKILLQDWNLLSHSQKSKSDEKLKADRQRHLRNPDESMTGTIVDIHIKKLNKIISKPAINTMFIHAIHTIYT